MGPSLNLKSAILVSVSLVLLFSLTGARRNGAKAMPIRAVNPQQAAGRRVFDDRWPVCHEAYFFPREKGPGLGGLFKQQYLSKSGLPANDEQVGDIIPTPH